MTDKKQRDNEVNPEMAAEIAEAESAAAAELCEEAIDYRAALAKCHQELAEAKNNYLRAHADFDNFRKRMRAERDQEFSRGSDRVLAEVLPVIDDFERALASVNESSTVESLQQGVELIHRRLLQLLDRYGITPMTVDGQPFDPQFHDAVARVVSDTVPEHTIIGEIQRGYLKGRDAFRPARVAVSVAPDEPATE